MRFRFDRTGPNGWEPYSPDRLTESRVESPWTFLVEEACMPGAGAFHYVTNADWRANVNDGTQIHSPVVVNEPTPGNCGSTIP
ncbi:hypothetical protein AB0H34_18715 [Saccharopolyspora shandongensis]|uniref:hypothetical protein n=1 Tax=Saccharopolyspora shandongensis TaxID=418495 RepID=UPI0033CEEEE7